MAKTLKLFSKSILGYAYLMYRENRRTNQRWPSYNMLHRVLKRAGLPSIRFHDLRNTFATLALQNGVDIKTVSGMLGHFSAGFTLDTYAHVTTSAQKEAAKTMGNVLAVE